MTRALLVLRLTAASLLLVTLVWATPSETERALTVGHDALQQYDRGNWQEALTRFREADRLAHSPVFTLFTARCEQKLGQLLAARRSFQRVIDERLADDAPGAWKSAVADAKRELSQLRRMIPRLVVRVEGADPARARVVLDGRTLGHAEAKSPIDVDPGKHTLSAELDGRKVARDLVSRAGNEQEVVLHLEPSASSKRPAATPSADHRPPRDRSRSYLAPGVAFGVGAAGIVAGTVFGLLASSRASEIKSRCEGNSCLASDADEGAGAAHLANASTVAFIVGGVGIGAGVTLLVLPSDSTGQRSASARATLRF